MKSWTSVLISVADSHFGVREVVWMSLRPFIAEDLSLAIPFLEKWTRSMDENVRRFYHRSYPPPWRLVPPHRRVERISGTGHVFTRTPQSRSGALRTKQRGQLAERRRKKPTGFRRRSHQKLAGRKVMEIRRRLIS